MELVLVTNNSLARDALSGTLDIHFVEGDALCVHDALEALLQDHHLLVTSPIPPNVPLIRSPVRSVIVQRQEKRYDAQGILTLEKSRHRLAVLGSGPGHRPTDRPDLEYIDLDHLRRTLTHLEADQLPPIAVCRDHLAKTTRSSGACDFFQMNFKAVQGGGGHT